MMEITERSRDNVAILDIQGEIVGDARFDLNDALQKIIDSDALGVIVNLEEVPMADSVGISMFVAAQAALAKKDKKITLLNAGRSVKYLLVVTKLSQYIEQYTDEDKALASFKKEKQP